MRPRTSLLTAALATGLLAATAATASADSLVAAAPGARNLTANGGYLVWASPRLPAAGAWPCAPPTGP